MQIMLMQMGQDKNNVEVVCELYGWNLISRFDEKEAYSACSAQLNNCN